MRHGVVSFNESDISIYWKLAKRDSECRVFCIPCGEGMSTNRIVLHFDMDCFYCQVETKRLGLSPDTPLVVHAWGMPLSVNYAAKAIGITRKTHAREAAEKGAVAVHMCMVDIQTGERFENFNYDYRDRDKYKSSVDRYRDASEQVMSVMKSIFPASSSFERASIDECFGDVSAADLEEMFPDLLDVDKLSWEGGVCDLSLDSTLARGALFGERIRAEVFQVSQYTVSCGVSETRQVAKLACALNKPDKLTVVSSKRTCEFMRNVPLKEIRGLGPRGFEILAQRLPYPIDGKTTLCGQLWGESQIGTDDFGKWLYEALRGRDGGNFVQETDVCANSVQSSKQFKPALSFSQLHVLLKAMTVDMMERLDNRGAKTLVVSLTSGGITRSRQDKFSPVNIEQLVLDLARRTGFNGENLFFEKISVGVKETFGNPSKARREVAEYLQASRLHFMGTWRARYLQYMQTVEETGDWGDASDVVCQAMTFEKKSTRPMFLMVDMDCFFCSVAIVQKGLDPAAPAAVASGQSGTSEICSANYPARKFGIKASSFVSSAREKCPHISIIPISAEILQQCEIVWKKVIRILVIMAGNAVNRVQGKSCDEAILDLSNLSVESAEIAKIVQTAIFTQTGVPCSVGIGPSRILAKLATTFAKPKGVKIVNDANFLLSLPVNSLPGVGYATRGKLASIGIETVADLLQNTSDLSAILGAQTFRKLLNTAKGIDNEEDEVGGKPLQTISSEKNFGLRNLTIDDTRDLLVAICESVCERLAGGVASKATLKLKIAVEGWTEPAKKGGIGETFDWSRTAPVGKEGNSANLAKILDPFLLEVDTSRIRGIGVSLKLVETLGATHATSKRVKLHSPEPLNEFPKSQYVGVTTLCVVCKAEVLTGSLTAHFLTHKQDCACPICGIVIPVTDSKHFGEHFFPSV